MVVMYNSFGEALDHIGWHGKGIRDELNITSEDEEKREKFRTAFWDCIVNKHLKGIHLEEHYSREQVSEMYSVFYDMIKNAEQRTPLGERFMAELYEGEQGVLFGTRQNANFFNPHQIKTLQRETPLPSKISGGMETQMMLDYADGLLIIRKAKLILVSKLVEKLE